MLVSKAPEQQHFDLARDNNWQHSNRDAVTPNQDWVIDHHPHCQNLFIAGGGSFHAWKFLPVIGEVITQRLLGQLDENRSVKWAWDRTNSGAANEMYIPTRDLKTIGPFNGWTQE